jgi:serine phosphatase RsbU (regulator of sigma subunit)
VLQVTETDDEGEESRLFEERGPITRYFNLLFILTLASWVVGWIYNYPMKRVFKSLRRGRDPDKGQLARTRKRLLMSPSVNGLVVAGPPIILIFWSIFWVFLKEDVGGELAKSTFTEFFFLSLLATLLEFLFVYYWQKHRVQLHYLEHIFSPEELRRRMQPRRGGKIRHRLLTASIMTTFLPLLIVLAYLLRSLTRVRNLDLDNLSPEAWEILMGPWGNMIGKDDGGFSLDQVNWMVYVHAPDSFIMIIGICMGILVSLLYLMLFIRWTNRDLSYPLKDVLAQMQNTREGRTEQYALVRTNDELGELAEGYNEMTHKIHEHMEHIFAMNRDLEQKVKERTSEVVSQKEEIEAQKEEIEAQLDLATLQRDTISRQNEHIMDSIRYAEKIQAALLPPALPMKEMLQDHFILFKPRDIVSGDFHWSAYRDGKLLLAAADCTGHGVPGAFLSILGISSLNEIVNRTAGLPTAGQILEGLRDYVIHALHQKGDRDEARDGIEIALIILDLDKMTLQFAGANRPMYLVRGKEVLHYKGDRMPIGIYGNKDQAFSSLDLSLQEGDSIYLFSDGYLDQMGGPRRKTFRAFRFRELLLQIRDLNMEEQGRVLEQKYMEWRGELDQIDDILVIGIRP